MTLVTTRQHWDTLTASLTEAAPHHVVVGPLGVTPGPHGPAALCTHSVTALAHSEVRGWLKEQSGPALTVRRASEGLFTAGPTPRLWPTPPGREPRVHLVLGSGADADRLEGQVDFGDRVEPLSALVLVGPGMARLAVPAAGLPLADIPERWSRTAGALGADAWRRLTGLRFAVIGAGRLGSTVAASLARMGVARLTLADPDRLELSNLDAMELVGLGDVGRTKVEAVARGLLRYRLATAVHIVASDVCLPECWSSLLSADVLINCLDDDAPRLLIGGLAALHNKLLLDLGTGVVDPRDRQGGAPAGADIRLLLPGERCLRCMGGVRDDGALTRLRSGQPRQPRPWHSERAGSLRSLNQIAAHLGLRLLEDLVAGAVDRSTWLRLTYGDRGIPSVTELSPQRDEPCPLCAAAGRGMAVGGGEPAG